MLLTFCPRQRYKHAIGHRALCSDGQRRPGQSESFRRIAVQMIPAE
jgi:hypothetical protein